MAVKKIRASNFKSFEDIKVELDKFNVLIGPNASGKSNFIEIFRFIRDVAAHGLSNAVSLQGGIEFLRNVNIGSSRDLSVQIVYDSEIISGVRRKKRLIELKPYEIAYEFALSFVSEGNFRISRDNLTASYEIFEMEDTDEDISQESPERLGKGGITLSNVEGKIKVDFDLPEKVPIKKEDIFPPFLTEIKLPPRTLLLETPFFSAVPPFVNFLEDISVYDFDPKLIKKTVPITGKMELEETGNNLAIVLKDIIGDKEKKRKFSNLVRDLLPFLDDVEVERFMDKSLLLKSREIYAQTYLPASLLSDGTINVIALITALYFEEKPLIVIEEPERNIHPFLISRVMDMLKEASEKKQIIVVTHNPEIVKYADLENILLISREKDGFSIISRLSEKKGVRTFLEHEIGIEELYVQNVLEG
jgi:predicted ATPase